MAHHQNFNKSDSNTTRSEENQIRQSQLISPFGVGALTDISNKSVMIADSEYWSTNAIERGIFHDVRLEKAMKVNGFVEPPTADKGNEFIQAKIFPTWYFCPDKTRELRQINDWKKDLRNSYEKKQFAKKPFCMRRGRSVELVPVRLVCACSAGHIQDFPWFEWAHAHASKKVGEKHRLRLVNSSDTGTIGDLMVRCSCGAHNSLTGIFGGAFQKTLRDIGVYCNGNFYWKQENNREKCEFKLQAVMRNANNLYFTNTINSVNIPLDENKNLELIKNTNQYIDLVESMNDTEPEEIEELLDEHLAQKMLEKISKSVDGQLSKDMIKKTLLKDYEETRKKDNVEKTQSDYRYEEYEVLTGEKLYREDTDRFSMKKYDSSEFPNNSLSNFFQGITLVNKLEVVSVLKSYSRIRPVESDWLIEQENEERADGTDINDEHMENETVPQEVSLRRSDNLFEGVQNTGEGIFVELNQDRLKKWEDAIHDTNFEKRILRKLQSEEISDFQAKFITPGYYLIHTLSHIVIRELSFICGYSSSALKERLYYADDEEKNPMSGFLIYTSSADADGTMGGLVRQGLPVNFFKVLAGALEKAKWCSFDPTCIDSYGQGRDALNLAACHACALVAETSCENMNLFLDRGMLIGTLENPELGFFQTE